MTDSKLPDHFQFFDDFSCRRDELDALLVSLKNFFSPADLTDQDRELLSRLDEDGEGAELRTFALVAGRSGMGKSRLLQEVKSVAQGSGVRVKEVFCYERQGIPLLPVLRVVKELLVESSQSQQLWDQYAPVLSRVYPELAQELGEANSNTVLSEESGKIQLFDAFAGILSCVGRERPLLLLIHDLHRSDPGTIEVLEYLARNVCLEATGVRSGDRALVPQGTDEVAGEDSWKEIGGREGRRSFITDGLADQSETQPSDALNTQVMVIANYLQLEEAAPEPEADAKSASVLDTEDALERRMDERISRLRQEPFVQHLSLPPLSEEELQSLMAKTTGAEQLDAGVVKRIHEATGGNPLHTLELCRCLRDDKALTEKGIDKKALDELLRPEAPAADEAGAATESTLQPSQLAERLVLRRLDTLNDIQRGVLRTLAMLRRPAPVSHIVELADADREPVEKALGELQERGFVKVLPVDRAPRFYLSHEDYVRTIYRAQESEERRELHGRIGRSLASQPRAGEPVRAYEVYEHLRHSSEPRECHEFGLTAARYFAGGYALELATEIENHLLELYSGAEDLPLRLELLSELSVLELRNGDPLRAKSHAKALLDHGDQLEPVRHLAAYVQLAEIYRAAGEPHKGIKTMNRAEKACAEALDDKARAQIAALRARLRLDRQDPKRAINLCMRGLQAIEGLEGMEPQHAELLDVLAEAHLARAEPGAALPHFQRLLEICETIGDEVKVAEVLSRLGRVYYDRGNYFRAARFLFKALDVIRRLGDVRGLSQAYDELGKVYRNSGDPIRGIEYFNRSLRLRERIGDLERLSPTLNSLGSLYAHTGNYFRAVRYFQRSVKNSQRFGDTTGLVRAFLHLGWIHYQIGELRQVESLAKQILILSQEFDLNVLEGEGHRLQGSLLFLRGDWRKAEREYRKAMEIAAKRSSKRGEAAAILDLGELLIEREEYEPALKLISKGQLLAEEIRSIPLRARANLLKGNVYRSLKGGNAERARESFHKGTELLSGENPLPLLWELQYSLAKVAQGALEFEEAASCYERAEQILQRIADTLPEDMKVAYHDDRRRKVFFEDYRRFRKEAAGRAVSTAIAPAATNVDERMKSLPDRTPASPGAATGESDRLLDAVERLARLQDPQQWLEGVLEQARRLVPSPAGALARVHGGELQSLAQTELGSASDWTGSDRFVGALCRQVSEARAPLHSGSESWDKVVEALPGGANYRNRSVLALPFEVGGSFVAVLYLDRPSAGNSFTDQDVVLLRRFLGIVSGHFATLESLRALRNVRGTSLLSWAGLEEVVRELAVELGDSQPLQLFEVRIPGLERNLATTPSMLAGRTLATALAQLGEEQFTNAPALVGNDTLVFLYRGDAEAISSEGILDIVVPWVEGFCEPGTPTCQRVRLEAQDGDGDDVVLQLRVRLLPRGQEFPVSSEIDRLTHGELTLKEAKSTLERRYITAELLKSRGNITRAAESLGIHRPQLSNLIKKYNVNREDFE